ncbi:unnamed protein product [Adineta steineri]|uniref:Uncharacterized protein n=1 Tax=Adineta steineri TaxID=433720 RepID=A0A814CFM7_9BILA|nr:unnamed protein product [Adineta steineri]CAF4073009.1 unnamed protein product [Adineta steineri]
MAKVLSSSFIFLFYVLLLVNASEQQQQINSTTTATCNFTACNSERIACSSNLDCDCFSLTSNPNIGICASTICSCASVVRCNMDNITCSIEGTICVNSTRCGQPVCYPLAMANKQICPPKTVTIPPPTFIDYFASAATDNSIKVWNSNNGLLIFNLTGHKSKIRELRKLNNNSVLSGSTDGVFKIWNISSGSFIRTLDCSNSYAIVRLELLPNGYIVGKCGEYMLNVWNSTDGKVVNNFKINNFYHEIVTLIVLSNGCIATGTWFAPIQILNPMTGLLITKSSVSITSLALIQLSNGNIANGDWDYTIKIFNTTTGKLVFNLVGHTGPVNSLALLSNGYLASASCYRDDNVGYYNGDKRILIWDPNTGSLVQTLTGHTDFVIV